jgi:hypothetical protein
LKKVKLHKLIVLPCKEEIYNATDKDIHKFYHNRNTVLNTTLDNLEIFKSDLSSHLKIVKSFLTDDINHPGNKHKKKKNKHYENSLLYYDILSVIMIAMLITGVIGVIFILCKTDNEKEVTL